MEVGEKVQTVVQELQLIGQQASAIANQVREMSSTLDLLESHEPGDAIFRQSGGILVQVGDIPALMSELKDGQEKLEAHVARLAEREAELRLEYEGLVRELEGSR